MFYLNFIVSVSFLTIFKISLKDIFINYLVVTCSFFFFVFFWKVAGRIKFMCVVPASIVQVREWPSLLTRASFRPWRQRHQNGRRASPPYLQEARALPTRNASPSKRRWFYPRPKNLRTWLVLFFCKNGCNVEVRVLVYQRVY